MFIMENMEIQTYLGIADDIMSRAVQAGSCSCRSLAFLPTTK
jgi:hypothetical protein